MLRLQCLKQKEVINVRDGFRFGCVSDLEICADGRINAIIVPGPISFLGFFGRDKEYYIKWCDIKCVGEDIILVDVDVSCVLRACI